MTNHSSIPFLRMVKHPIRSRMFLLFNLPSAYFSGVRIQAAAEDACLVTVKYKWFSKNPFGSTYFACLSMAAEMSTGVLAMAQVYKRQPVVSMLVVKMEARYLRRARGITYFLCSEGVAMRSAIQNAIATGEAQTITVQATGTSASNDFIALFSITWSFKVKK